MQDVCGDPLEEEVLEQEACLGPRSLGGESSGYLSGSWSEGGEEVPVLSAEEEREFWSAVGYNLECSPRPGGVAAVLARVRQEDRLSMSSLGSEDSPRQPGLLQEPPGLELEPPSLGPFLTLLLDKVSSLPQHCLGTNLRLTALVSKLASFPHPLLKAVLLHPDVVVQPSCLTLTQVRSSCAAQLLRSSPGHRHGPPEDRLLYAGLAGGRGGPEDCEGGTAGQGASSGQDWV